MINLCTNQASRWDSSLYVLYANDDQSLYESSLKMGFQLVCPIRKYKNTSEERLQLVDFYESPLGQAIYSKRRISEEPLIEHIKSIFRIDPVHTRGFDNVRGIVLLSVLLYSCNYTRRLLQL